MRAVDPLRSFVLVDQRLEAAMTLQLDNDARSEPPAGEDARARLLAGLPVTERRLDLAGVSTAVLEGGDGRPIVLLHEQGEFAARWMRVIPDLVRTHGVVAPDLPGHGSSEVTDGDLDADRMKAWLSELIERTCATPPVLVGHMLSGAIAARFAIDHGDRLSRLVLVDSFGVGRFRPSPRFVLALFRYVTRPNERTYGRLLRQCLVDPDGMRDQLGERWEPWQEYVLDRARTPAAKAALPALMRKLGVPAIPPAELARITVPTTLIWGRHDPVMRPKVAEAASARLGWPLHVIENAGDDPPVEQPEEFLRVLRAAIGSVPVPR
jgi:pimeloyl-ACP methyl ester carboxylesterase